MLQRSAAATIISLVMLVGTPAFADVIYSNLTPNNMMATATRPDSPGVFEIEAADDFALTSSARINSASFVGLLVPNPGATPTVSGIVVEMYRVFPLDSNTVRTPNVVTRTNSPSDVAFASKDSAAGELTFSSQVLNATFMALNSVQPGGIHPAPGQTTGGNGPLTGQEVQFNVSFSTPFNLPADHFFFVPQVAVTGGQFYWLSALRPVSFPPGFNDLQTWTRDAMLDPDWSRVGTDIVGGTPFPTFNAAFSLDGTVPEPSTVVLVGSGIIGFAVHIARRRRPAK
jgi:hypothetical protein